MRTDHIRNFNLACASVARLAAEAIEEHRRQIEQIEALGREALELADKLTADAQSLERQQAAAQLKAHAATALMPRTIASAAAPASVPAVPEVGQSADQEFYAAASKAPADPRADGADSGDILTLAMRRVEHEETIAPKDEVEEPMRDLAVLAVGREIVASLSGKRRQRRSNAR